MPATSKLESVLTGTGILRALRGGLRYLFGKRGERLVHGLRLFYRLRLMVILRAGGPIGKLTRGNEVRVWVDGEAAFRRLERLIGRAKHTIVIQMFIWKNDTVGRQMAGVLLRAAERGVQVDITKDSMGDFFEYTGDFLGTRKSVDPVWHAFWHHQNIRITYEANSDHAKVYVIDDQILLLTGMNIADEYRYRWHDYMVELRGSQYVNQFLTSAMLVSHEQGVALIMNTDRQKEIRPVLMELLSNARESVVVEHCYISDSDVINELVALSKRAVRVTVIAPKTSDFNYHANMGSIGRLIGEGDSAYLRVLFYPEEFHAKIILVDHKIAFLGSANLMKLSLDESGEVNVLIRGRSRALRHLREILRQDILRCQPINTMPGFSFLSKWLSWLGL